MPILAHTTQNDGASTSDAIATLILAVEQVQKSYAAMLRPAVTQLSLDLRSGELMSLLGPSGCGKTTLLRLIAGFERPEQGRICFANQVVDGDGQWLPPESRDIGIVFQDYALFPHLTVAKNVAFGLKVQSCEGSRRQRDRQIQARVSETLDLVGLADLGQRYPHELSGGQQQRVALARALAPRPKLVLLDEPFSNLDVEVRLRLRQEVREILKTTATSAIFVTHDQEEALAISDRVAVMRHGRLEQVGTPEELYYRPISRFVAGFVTQANFLPAARQGQVWQTEVGVFQCQAASLLAPSAPNFAPSSTSASVELATTGGDDHHAGALQTNQIVPDDIMPDDIVTEAAVANASAPLDTSNYREGELMIRQEDLQLEPDEAGDILIRDRQFLGREYRYCLKTPSGRELHARSTDRQPLAIGTRVKLAIASPAVQVFIKGETHPPRSPQG